MCSLAEGFVSLRLPWLLQAASIQLELGLGAACCVTASSLTSRQALLCKPQGCAKFAEGVIGIAAAWAKPGLPNPRALSPGLPNLKGCQLCAVC